MREQMEVLRLHAPSRMHTISFGLPRTRRAWLTSPCLSLVIPDAGQAITALASMHPHNAIGTLQLSDSRHCI